MIEPARAPAPDPSPDPAARVGPEPAALPRACSRPGSAALEARREEVNELNVFPVADGDTGDNMVLTLRAVLDELDRLATRAPGRDDRAASAATRSSPRSPAPRCSAPAGTRA